MSNEIPFLITQACVFATGWMLAGLQFALFMVVLLSCLRVMQKT